VRLGFVGSLGTWLVPRLLTHYRCRIAGTTISLTAAASDVLAERLLDDRLDLVLLGPRPVHPDLEWVPLHEEQLCLSVPPGHRLAGRASVHLAEAAGEPFVAYQADTGMRQISDELCRAVGIDPAVTLESSDVATVDALVAAGMGVALRPTARGDAQPAGVVHVPLAEPLARREIGMAWMRDRTSSAAVARFRELAIDAVVAVPGASGAPPFVAPGG
jgi:DNA-binding transcriptional LysR family regulator